MYEKRLGDANYSLFKLARTNNRGDGEPSSIFSACRHRNGQNIILCCVVFVPAAVEIAFYYEAGI
jgi:hypothetical protein